MSDTPLNCPSCGSAIKLNYRFTKTVTCPSCQVTSQISGNDIVIQGEKIELANYGSLFHVGANGKMFGEDFNILGRVRFAYPDGFWDEWLVQIPSKPDVEFWLHEDEGDMILFHKDEELVSEIPAHGSLSVGFTYSFGDTEIFITERNSANIMGCEGELPFLVKNGDQADFMDGTIVGSQRMVSFEYLKNETIFCSGKIITPSDITVNEKTSPYA